jgi:hypothetical protein
MAGRAQHFCWVRCALDVLEPAVSDLAVMVDAPSPAGERRGMRTCREGTTRLMFSIVSVCLPAS